MEAIHRLDEIQTKAGTAKPMPLSDLQENNIRLKRIERILGAGVILSYLFFCFILFLFWYVVSHGVVNNITADIARALGTC